MTLFFNLQTLESETGNDPNYIVQALYYFYKGIFIPKTIHTKYRPLRRLKEGFSFLLNPEPLFNDKRTENIHKAQYIKLAGRRSYINFTVNKDARLDLTMFPDINISAIETNPIIQIIDNKIQFKYEEIKWH